MQPSHSNTGDSGLAARLVGILNHDFCPGANRWVYWLKHPAVPLVAAAGAALICGVMVNANALIVGLALVAVLVLGCVWPWIVVRGLRAELEFDHARGREGEPSGVRVRISNRCPWPALGLALERGFSRFGSEEKGVALARIAGWSNTEFRWEFTPDSRGEFPCEPCRLVTAFPFGLWRAARPVRVVAPLLVWPRIVPLASIPDAADLTPAEEGLSPRRVGQTGDLMGTRGFREGDSLRRVHWPQTARQGR
ncbi:MAG: DUF58 domain-containing protein, partial [Planctomycetaceae bacterium]